MPTQDLVPIKDLRITFLKINIVHSKYDNAIRSESQ